MQGSAGWLHHIMIHCLVSVPWLDNGPKNGEEQKDGCGEKLLKWGDRGLENGMGGLKARFPGQPPGGTLGDNFSPLGGGF